MGLRDLGDLDWEILCQIHEAAVEFYQADKEMSLAAMMPHMAPEPEKTSFTARELKDLDYDGGI